MRHNSAGLQNVVVDVNVDETDHQRDSETLAHERLDVYQCAIEFLAVSALIVDALPKGNAILADQLKRAALSIPLNIAEGAGKPSPRQASHIWHRTWVSDGMRRHPGCVPRPGSRRRNAPQ